MTTRPLCGPPTCADTETRREERESFKSFFFFFFFYRRVWDCWLKFQRHPGLTLLIFSTFEFERLIKSHLQFSAIAAEWPLSSLQGKQETNTKKCLWPLRRKRSFVILLLLPGRKTSSAFKTRFSRVFMARCRLRPQLGCHLWSRRVPIYPR